MTGWNVTFDIRILRQTTGKHDLDLPAIDTFDMLDFYRRTRRRRYNSLSDAMREQQGVSTYPQSVPAETGRTSAHS